jgi:hypothetical protein
MPDTQAILPEVHELRHTVKSLELRVSNLERGFLVNGSEQSSRVIDEVPAEVLSITRDLFPGDVSVRTLDDPEYPGDSYVVIDATASGDVKEIEGRRLEWHSRVRKFGPPGRIWRLSLTYLT